VCNGETRAGSALFVLVDWLTATHLGAGELRDGAEHCPDVMAFVEAHVAL
jgi:hypothetical protein